MTDPALKDSNSSSSGLSVDECAEATEEKETFEDASEKVQVPSEMDLATAIQETTTALNLFLNNRYSEAKNRMQPWHVVQLSILVSTAIISKEALQEIRYLFSLPKADRSMYHALGYGTIMYLQATLTFEMTDIQAAVTAVKQAVAVCDQQRKKQAMLTRTNFADFTEEQIHAEVCYAELLMERALLTFVQDENLISFVKGSLKIRACHNSYKDCVKILQQRDWDNCTRKMHFESGVKLGIGIFNLMISLLPTKILRLLEFVGFSGNKKKGLSELEGGAMMEKSLRGPLCSLTLLGYHTVMTYVLGTADGDIELSERLLKPCLQNYPRGALFLFFAGRIEEIKGNIDEAIYRFEESIEAQSEWRQFHHLCYWELMWCQGFKGDWLLAMKYAERLCRESRWSKATYTYQKAAFLMACDEVTQETKEHIVYLMGEVPRLKQRIAGKSIPIEKFAVKKAKRFVEQGLRLTLPALELIYVWNGFMIIGKKPSLVEPILTKVEMVINEINAQKDTMPNYYDDYCLALLLKGVCLKFRGCGQEFQAEQCFREIWTLEKKLKQDHYLVPYALLELSMLFIQSHNLEEAKNILDKSKKDFKGYSLESRLHFRVHAANLQLKALQCAGEEGGADSDNSQTDMPETPPQQNYDLTPTPPPSPTRITHL